MATNSLRLARTTTVATVLGLGSVAFAQEAVQDTAPAPLAPGIQFSLKLEPGLAAALTKPQTSRTELGMGHTVQLLFGVNRYLAIGPSIAYTMLPADGVMMESGKAWTFGAGGRLMRPHDSVGYYGLSPWIDASALYVRTGDLDRPGFATGAGVSMPLDNLRRYWLGPYARYSQIIQGDRDGFDNRDAKILTFGLGLEITSGLQRTRARVAVATPPVEPIVPPPSDRDGDGILDTDDNCPDVVGLLEHGGCPPYEKVIVKREKLEVTEKISFLWDSAKLEDSSYPALDEVVRALQDNRGFKVQVDGHASSDGDDAHNMTLSDQRAAAVLDYLVSKGVAKDRLISKGFGSTVPAQTNTTIAGRESNRRVEFIVEFIIVN
jgi:outer membrane protein OmpA-like peptidoglycan-associated protein